MDHAVVDDVGRAVYEIETEVAGYETQRTAAERHDDDGRALDHPKNSADAGGTPTEECRQPARCRGAHGRDRPPSRRRQGEHRHTPLGIAEQLDHPWPREQLDSNHAGAPQQLDRHQRGQRRAASDQAHGRAHDRRRRPHAGPRGRKVEPGTVLGDEQRQGADVDDPEAEGHSYRNRQRIDTTDGWERRQAGRGQSADRYGHPDCADTVGQAALDDGIGVETQAGVDVPRLQRARVQRAEHALHRAGNHERTRAVSCEEKQERDHVQRRRRQENRSAAKGIGQAPGGQLQGDDDCALDRHHQPDLRERQAAGLRQHRSDGNEQPRGQPAQQGEPNESADHVSETGVAGRSGGCRRRHTSSPAGKAYSSSWTGRASGGSPASPSPRRAAARASSAASSCRRMTSCSSSVNARNSSGVINSR